jgi:hypothetical protein
MRPPPRAPDKEMTMSSNASAFLDRWKTDVEPVHDKTERSREFRTGYWVMGLRTMFGMNAVALVAVPAVGRLLGVSFADHMDLFLRAEASFLLGIACMIVAILFSLITLDTDVIRQKGERASARQRLIDDEFPGYFEDSIESERVKSERHQRKYWRPRGRALLVGRGAHAVGGAHVLEGLPRRG